VQFGVLGTLQLSVNGVSYLPSAPKPRQLLALLMLHANEVVSIGACTEELWGTRPPRTTISTLQTYVLQIRRMLRRVPETDHHGGGEEMLVTRDNGYQLKVPPDCYDRAVFERGVLAGYRAAAVGDDLAASNALGQALNVWRGPALVDVQAGSVTATHLVGLEETRIAALEQRIEADLRLGRHHGMLGELSTLVRKYPTYENLHAQFMLALYRSGRQAKALEVFRELRGELAGELGIEPSHRMQRLHNAILSADPALEAPRQSGPVLSRDLLAHEEMAASGRRTF
jgi:DNA-binding SARP family transcriptional activator